LSGGQKQKVLLARALCSTKKILLLDEPTSSLDVDATNELYGILKRLNEQEKITIIMISHDINSLNYVNKVLRTGEDVYLLDVKEYKRRLDNGTI
jgi:zinc transport system ATP-binding protein